MNIAFAFLYRFSCRYFVVTSVAFLPVLLLRHPEYACSIVSIQMLVRAYKSNKTNLGRLQMFQV